ncbi:conserved hypothetical protein [metagenome]|uniref:N-acetyltransferase domain-containing protein n=1 Tax=metagenome TaxID=256318 RepID=A0A2P2BWY5_9ZZZZ
MDEIRVLTADEWQVWREIRLRSLAESPDAFGSTLAREQAFTEDDWHDRLRSVAVVAFVEGRPVSLGGGYRVRPGWLQVVAMWTDPAHRGAGLAGRVLDVIVAAAYAEDRRLVLDVERSNASARAAYERFGFVATGTSHPLREGSDLMVDEMTLPSR